MVFVAARRSHTIAHPIWSIVDIVGIIADHCAPYAIYVDGDCVPSILPLMHPLMLVSKTTRCAYLLIHRDALYEIHTPHLKLKLCKTGKYNKHPTHIPYSWTIYNHTGVQVGKVNRCGDLWKHTIQTVMDSKEEFDTHSECRKAVLELFQSIIIDLKLADVIQLDPVHIGDLSGDIFFLEIAPSVTDFIFRSILPLRHMLSELYRMDALYTRLSKRSALKRLGFTIL